jgi:phenylacetate-CoA ligase
MRHQIQDKFGIKACDIYGLSEIIGPGVAFECLELQHGLHINEDYFYPEIIDPETCEVLPEGELGELVFTTIANQGQPLLRFRTRDITRLSYDACICGRTLVKMDRVSGRSDDMLIIRVTEDFMIKAAADILKGDEFAILEDVATVRSKKRNLQQDIKDVIGITVVVDLVPPGSIARSEGKAKRIEDRRPE